MSKNRSYLEQIDDEIAYHRTELEQLQIARQVIARLATGSNSKPTPPVIEHQAADTGITIRRLEQSAPDNKASKAAKPKTAARGVSAPARTEDKAILKQKVLNELAIAPLKSGDLIEKFAPPNPVKAEKQFIYALLYDLKRTGVVSRDDEALYSLAHTNH